LLGRYMFVEVDYPRQSFGQLMATRGVEAVIPSAGVPWPMPRVEVEDLLQWYMAGEFEVANEPVPVRLGWRS
jgi:transcription antitermination factor NusG